MKTPIILFCIICLLGLLAFSSKQNYVFNIPQLIGKSIVEIQSILGKPQNESTPTAAQIKMGLTGDKYFFKAGYTLDVQYNAKTNKVIDFFLSQDKSVENYHILEQCGNIRNSTLFVIRPIQDNKYPSKYTGINITPK